ncbi:MAG: glycosyltransferase family protein, partial [Burkholderiales bacterium]|nr:glycosyltransferase family protein [Burkholderiales bacterium]
MLRWLRRRETAMDPGETPGDTAFNDANRRFASGNAEAAIPLYRLALDHAPNDLAILLNLAQAYRSTARLQDTIEVCRRAINAAPRDPRPAALLARTLTDVHADQEALALFRSVSTPRRTMPGFWSDYGRLLHQMHRDAEAIDAQRRALSIDPDHASALNNLGLSLLELHRLEEAEACLLRAVAIPSVAAAAQANLANLRAAQNRLEEAIDLADRAIAAGLETPQVRFSRGLALLAAGRMTEGFADCEHRLQTPAYAGMTRNRPGVLWNGESLQGRSILLWHEQGHGDTLQFVRYVDDLLAMRATVRLEAQKPLVRLLQANFEVDVQATGSVWKSPADFHLPLMSLPHRLGETAWKAPWRGAYLRRPATDPSPWPAVPRGLKVGLVWAGNPTHRNDANRSIPPALLKPLLSVPDVTFFPLQFDVEGNPAAVPTPSARWADLRPSVRDFADLAALLEQLDLLITVDTAAAHLSGSLAKPTWVLLPFASD